MTKGQLEARISEEVSRSKANTWGAVQNRSGRPLSVI